MTSEEEGIDFQRELAEKEAIHKMPMNGLSRSALQNVKQSNISKRIENHYKNMTLSEFLEVTSIKPKL